MSEDKDTPVKGILDIDQAIKADRKEFRRLLFKKHSLPTILIFTLITVWYFATSFYFGIPLISPTADQLLLVGVLTVDPSYISQYWRAFTNIFVHYGLVHFLLNSLTFVILGPFIDYMYGRIHLVTIFIFGGLFSNLVSLIILKNSHPVMGTTGALFALLGSLLMFLPQLERRTSPNRLQWIWIATFVMCSLGLSVYQLGANFHMLWFGLGFGIIYGILGSYFNFHSPVRKSIFVSSIFLVFMISSYLTTQMSVGRQLESADSPIRKNLEELQVLSSEYFALRDQFTTKMKSSKDFESYTDAEKWVTNELSPKIEAIYLKIHKFQSADKEIYQMQLQTYNDIIMHRKIIWNMKNNVITFLNDEAWALHWQKSEQSLTELVQNEKSLAEKYKTKPRISTAPQ